MTTNQTKYPSAAGLVGNVDLFRNTLPTLRSGTRRLDPDGVSTVPYYASASGKTLRLNYTNAALGLVTTDIALTSNSLAQIITDIKAADATNIDAFDLGGFIAVRNKNQGKTHFLTIKPFVTPASDAAPILGFVVDPFPGSTSFAGELAPSPATRKEANPQTAGLIALDEDFSSKSLNRPLYMLLQLVETMRAELRRDVVVYKDVTLTFAAHAGDGEIAARINDDNLRVFYPEIDAITVAQLNPYYRVLDLGQEQLTSTTVSPAGVHVKGLHYATAGTPFTGALFATWGTPDGGVITSTATVNITKHAAVNITSIKGNIVECATATFVTKKVKAGDPIQLAATNLQPFDHSGWFAVDAVIDETHLAVRPMSISEQTPVPGGYQPRWLNPAAGGTLRVALGRFVPAGDIFVSITGVAGSQTVRLAIGVPFNETIIDDQARGLAGTLDKLALALQLHLDAASNAHAPTAISGFTSTTSWRDTTTITGANLRTTIEDILTDLKAQAVGDSGSNRVGAEPVSIGGALPNTIIAGTIWSQLTAMLTVVRDHMVDKNRHNASGVISGFNNTSNVGLTFNIATGSALLTNDTYANPTGTGIALSDNATNYLYIDSTDFLVKKTTVQATAFTDPNLVLWQAITAAGAVTSTTDLRRKWSPAHKRASVTVGDADCDFTTFEGAFRWIEVNRNTADLRTWEIVILGSVAMTKMIFLSFPLTIRGAGIDGSSIIGGPLARLVTPSGLDAFNISANNLNDVVFRDLYVSIPLAAGSRFLATGGVNGGDHWLFHNCVFDGGTDSNIFSINPSVSAGNWTWENCWFKNSTRTVETAYVLMNGPASGFRFLNCRFVGETADTKVNGIEFGNSGTPADTLIQNCDFTMGGLGVKVTGLADGTVVDSCRFKSSRAAAVTHTSSGELTVTDCKFDTCMTNSDTTQGVIFINNGGPALMLRNRIKNWDTGYALNINSSGGHRFDHNVLTCSAAMAATRAILCANDVSMMFNDIDMEVGATSGNGAGATALVIQANDRCRIIGNLFKNAGDTASAGTTTVVQFESNCIVSDNLFFNCRGALIMSNADNNVICNNNATDLGTSANDIGITIGGGNCVASGNAMTHSGSAKGFHVTLSNLDAHIHSNALASAVTTVNASGLGGSLVRKRVLATIGSKTVGAGVTQSVAFIPMPTRTYGVHLIEQMDLPAKVGNLEPGIRVTYGDGTTTSVFNTTAGTVPVRVDDDNAAGDFVGGIFLDLTDDFVVTAVEVVVRNPSGGSDTQTLGQYRYYGWVLG